VFRCLSLAEGGLGCLALKNAIIIFAVIDILIGVFSALQFLNVYLNRHEYFIYHGYDGTLYFLVLNLWAKPIALIFGITGLVAALQLNPNIAKFYYKAKLVEMVAFPLIGMLTTIDMLRSYTYYQNDMFIIGQSAVWNGFKFAYYFYVAYIAISFQRRLEKGEIILVSHGRSIVELVN
jgi:hypothetical protein